MNAKIFSFEQLIGTAELRIGDASMGHLYGEFSPTEEYYKLIQPIIWEITSSSNPSKHWNSLKLNVQLNNEYFLYAAGGITINDLVELPNELKQVDIAGVDRHVIEVFFLQDESRPFVEEPWEAISIEQKIVFEEELAKELGFKQHKGLFDFFCNSSVHLHELSDFKAAALCHNASNDDVLFRITKQQSIYNFAVVHLTWRGSKEVEGYPKFQLFESFDEFKYLRMYPDKADWEY